MRSPLRVYADTSVFGGCFEEIQAGEHPVLRAGTHWSVRAGCVRPDASGIVTCPERVQNIVAEIVESCLERVSATPESEALARQYLDVKVVGPSCVDDARHIAVATIMDVDVVVSWNSNTLCTLRKYGL